MRSLIFLLVLGNLLFYAFSQGMFGEKTQAPLADAQEINPQHVRILSRGEAPSEATPASAPSPTASADAPDAAGPLPEIPAQTPLCLQWPALSAEEGKALRRALEEKLPALSAALDWQEIPAPAHSWWVYIPALADRARADKKAAELKTLGVTDYFVVQDGAHRHAISLGIFSNEKSANDHLNRLREQGVRSASLAPRPDKTAAPTLRLRAPGEHEQALRSLLASTLPATPAQNCP